MATLPTLAVGTVAAMALAALTPAPDLAAFKAAAEPIHVEIGKIVGEDFMAHVVELSQ